MGVEKKCGFLFSLVAYGGAMIPVEVNLGHGSIIFLTVRFLYRSLECLLKISDLRCKYFAVFTRPDRYKFPFLLRKNVTPPMDVLLGVALCLDVSSANTV